jgi:hypothetical protein
MPQLVALGLGTLYTVQGAKHSNSTNIGPMQTLAWLVKDNRPPDERKTGRVAHKWHPDKASRLLETPQDAYEYAAEIYTSTAKRALDVLGLPKWSIALVPAPASCTTKVASSHGRWPALAMAKALEVRGFGRVVPCLVNKKATDEQTLAPGKRTPAHEIASNMEIVAKPPSGHAVLFVDDVITWGRRLAAMNHVLQWRGPTAALCVAFTSEQGSTVDCYKPKRRVIAYGTSSKPWLVTISKPEGATT